MNILINTASLRSGGGLQVACSLVRELSLHSECRLDVLLSPQMAMLLQDADVTANVRLHRLTCNPAASPAAFLRYRRRARALEAAVHPDAVLTVFGPAWWTPRAPHLVGFANGLYLFDDSYFIRNIWPKGWLQNIKYRGRRWLMLRQLGAESNALWVETDAAAAALSRIIPRKQIHVVGNAAASSFLAGVQTQPLKHKAAFRLLTVAAPHPNKNLALIAAVLPLLKDLPVQFVVTLPEADFMRIFGETTGDEQIMNMGPVHPEQLATCYAEADAVFLPSWLETFSAAYPEAMAAGLPILASDLPFAHDICGPAALYFDPADPASAAAAIRQLVHTPDLRQRLVQSGKSRLRMFGTAAGRARTLLDILRKLAGSTKDQK